MGKHIKFIKTCLLLTGAGLILVTAGILAGGTVYGLSISGDGIQVQAPLLDKNKKEETVCKKEEEKLEAFDAVMIDGEYENVRIEASGSDEYSLSYCLNKDNPLRREIKDGRLILRHENKKVLGIKNFTWFSVGNSRADRAEEYVTVRVPKEAKLKSAEIKTDSGDAACENIQADTIKIEADYGRADFLNVSSETMEIKLDSGDLKMENVQAGQCTVQSEYGDAAFYHAAFTGGMNIAMDSGDIRCSDTSFGTLSVTSAYGNLDIQESEAGNVQMSLENGNVRCFDASMDSLNAISAYGDFDIQNSRLGNVQMSLENGECKLQQVQTDGCKINAEYGSVKLALKQPVTDYAYRLITEYGTVKIGGRDMGRSYASLDEENQKQIEITCESGDILIE